MSEFHLEFELLARYAERSADAIDREIVETHAEDCEQCRGELEDLVAYATPRRFLWSAGLLARRRRAESPPLQGARWAIAAAMLVAIFAGSLFLRESAPAPRALHIPKLAADLAASERLLRGFVHNVRDIEPLSPVGAMLLNDQPRFEWAGPRNARYRIEIFDEAFHPVAASPELTARSWRPPQPLLPGKTYVWQITMTLNGNMITFPAPPAPEARFHVIDRHTVQQIARLEAHESRPSVTLGAAYAEAGALAEAQRELSAALAANRNADTAREYLREVQLHTP